MSEPASEKATFPLLIVLNAESGRKDISGTRATIERILTEAGRAYKLLIAEGNASTEDVARSAAAEARDRGGAVIAAGGDGTVSTVARAALDSGCAFGVLPQGTFNYFARAHGIPESTEDAVNLLLTAQACPVQVGLVNGKAFLVNASLGLHPQMLEDREAFTQRYGRSRWVAIWAGITTLFRYRRQLHIRLELKGQACEIRTSTLFVCNNPLQLEQIGIPLAHKLEQGQLAAFRLRPVGTLSMLWLLIRGALGQLGEAKNVISFAFDNMRVTQPGFYGRSRIKVAIDGETEELRSPVEFRVSPEPLYLLKPRASEGHNSSAHNLET